MISDRLICSFWWSSLESLNPDGGPPGLAAHHAFRPTGSDGYCLHVKLKMITGHACSQNNGQAGMMEALQS